MQFMSVVPMFQDLLQLPPPNDNLPLCMPSLFSLISMTSLDDYRSNVKPLVTAVLNMQRTPEVTVYILERLDIILSKSSEEDIRGDILPMVFSTLETNQVQAHEAAIGVFAFIRRYTDELTIRKLVLPRTKVLFTKSTNVQTKLNALACLDRLLDSFDKMTILEEVLPFVTDISCTDVDVTMAIISIYHHLLSDRKYGLTHNLLATKVMPSLIPYAVAPGLTISQFTQLIDLLREMLGQVDQQRRVKMLSEVPDSEALENRSNLQQMHTMTQQQQTPNIRLPDDFLFIPRGRRTSANSSISNSSNTSAYCGRRLSQDFRFSTYEPCSPLNKYLLSVDRRNSVNRFGYRQAPSTPELQTRTSSKDSLAYSQSHKKCSSYTGLGSDEQESLDKMVRDRRASVAHRLSVSTGAPHIYVSEASLGTDRLGGWSLFGSSRRCSTQSVGPVVVPEPGRRNSQGRLLDNIQSEFRRASFQGICESAMQFFSGK